MLSDIATLVRIIDPNRSVPELVYVASCFMSRYEFQASFPL